MKHLKNVCCLFLVLTLFAGCSYERTTRQVWRDVFKPEHQMNPDRLIGPAGLQADIDFFVKTLEEVHPNPYHNISAEAYHKKADSLKATLTDSLNRREFFLAFAPLVSSLKESHTDVIAPLGALERYKKAAGDSFRYR